MIYISLVTPTPTTHVKLNLSVLRMYSNHFSPYKYHPNKLINVKNNKEEKIISPVIKYINMV